MVSMGAGELNSPAAVVVVGAAGGPPRVSGGYNSFNCHDVAGAAHYGTCVLR